MSSPIQIILNDRDFQTDRDKGRGGSKTDFFWNDDKGFVAHKKALKNQLISAADRIQRQTTSPLATLKVVLRRSALAKGHRPIQKLFTNEATPTVGALDLGTILMKARPSALREIAAMVDKAEEVGRSKFDEQKEKLVADPTRIRSEVGAIEHVSIFDRADRRTFDLETAVNWLKQPRTGGAYIVELFDYPPPRPLWDSLPRDEQNLFQSFVNGLSSPTFSGLIASRILAAGSPKPSLGIKLSSADDSPRLPFLASSSQPSDSGGVVSEDRDKHAQLLSFLESHPLVRSIGLPPIVRRTDGPKNDGRVSRQALQQAPMFFMPQRDEDRSYPKIGIVDGGVSDYLSPWIIDRWDTLAESDIDAEHGTFIGGLLIAAAEANSTSICGEPAGADLVDIQLLPSENVDGAFNTYYPAGAIDFFEEVEMAVADAKSRHGVRVFNFSLNVENPVELDSYSPIAAKLDQIAEDNDVLFVVSAGNAESPDTRPEWHKDRETALADLATARNDRIWVPAESSRAITVGAINPPGMSNIVAGAPARYSRRGPGVRAAVKPDVAHYGGAGTPCPVNGLGLRSIMPNGSITTGCGTSYAAPMVAKTIAQLDHEIEGDVSRETLMALTMHNANLPEVLKHKSLSKVARQLVGFGLPASSHEILEGSEDEITLVFASRLMRDQQVVFEFSWPRSLVGENGKCRGEADLTLVSSPPLDRRFGAEFVRVNLSGSLQQEQIDKNGKTSWKGQLEPIYLPGKTDEDPMHEAQLIEHGLKWSPIKAWRMRSPKGRGKSSNWKMKVNYLTRAGEAFPDEGVPFTAVLTLKDSTGEAPVFDEMRQTLRARNVQVEDIRTASRVATRT